MLLIAGNNLYNKYDQWENARSGTTCHDLAKKRAAFFKEHTQYTPKSEFFAPKDISILLSYSFTAKVDQYVIKNTLDIKQRVEEVLSAVHANPKNVAPQQLHIHLSQLLNLGNGFYNNEPDFNKKFTDGKMLELSEQWLQEKQNFEVTSNGIYQQGGKYCLKTFNVTRFPKQGTQFFMTDLIGDQFNEFMRLGCPFFLHYGIHIDDNLKLANKMKKKIKRTEKLAYSPIHKLFPNIEQEKKEWQLVKSQFDQGHRVVETRFQAGLFGDSDYVQEEGASQLRAVFAVNKWGIDSDLAQLPALMSCLPMSWGSGAYKESVRFKKTKTTLSSEPTHLIPIQGDRKETEPSGVLLTSRRGQVFTWTPFDNKVGNFHTLLHGHSGSFAEILMQEMMCSTLGSGGTVFVFAWDKGNKALTKMMNGEIIDLSSNEICVNPFNFVKGESEQDIEDALVCLKSIVMSMAYQELEFTEFDESLIDQAIKHTWKLKGNSGSIDDIVSYLAAHDSKAAHVLGAKLLPYSSNGEFGHIFCGKSTLKLSKQMVMFNVQNMTRECSNIMQKIVLTAINAKLYEQGADVPSQIFLDKGWKDLKGPGTKEFVDSIMRCYRKFKASLVLRTQSYGNMQSSTALRTAYENSDCICCLQSKASTSDALVNSDHLNLTSHQKKLCKSVKVKFDHYIELAITMNGDFCAVGALRLDPFSETLFSSCYENVTELDAYLAEGFTVNQSIENILNKKENIA